MFMNHNMGSGPENNHPTQLERASLYIEALAGRAIPGQNTPREREYVHTSYQGREVDPGVFADRVSYQVPTDFGGTRLITVEKIYGQLNETRITWGTSRSDVRYYTNLDPSEPDSQIALLLMGGEVSFPRDDIARHIAEAMPGDVETPDSPGAFVRLRVADISNSRLMNGQYRDEAVARFAQLHEAAGQRLAEGQGEALPVVGIEDASDSLKRDAARYTPEQVGVCLAEIARATGVMPLRPWLDSLGQADD